jgi:hypothetical protein
VQIQFHDSTTNLAIGSTKSIGIMNQVHYIDNQFNLNVQSISLHVVNNFMIWDTYLNTTSQNQFHELYNSIPQRTTQHVYDFPNHFPRLALPKFGITSIIQPWAISTLVCVACFDVQSGTTCLRIFLAQMFQPNM